MNNNLFTSSSTVISSRILYTPSSFAKSSLLHLQEVGSLEAIKPHTSTRSNLLSYLCFTVTTGSGELIYNGKKYKLNKGDCVFIDCRKTYSHRTSDDLWSLAWCHFSGPELPAVYDKYCERGGEPVFHPDVYIVDLFIQLINELYNLAASTDYIRDMRINEKLCCLLTLLMEESWHPDNIQTSRKRLELQQIKEYIDEHFTEKILLNDLASMFFINKYYLTKIFKEIYGIPINGYILQKRVTKAKQLLRFSDMSIDEIGSVCGMNDANYFSRMFKKIEGISPSEYRKIW